MYLLGYDIGSSSVKASLVNAESGKCVSSAFFPKTEAEIIAVKPGCHRHLLPDARLGMCGQERASVASRYHLVRFKSCPIRSKSN